MNTVTKFRRSCYDQQMLTRLSTDMESRSVLVQTSLPVVIHRSSPESSARVTSLRALFCFVFVLILQFLILFSQSWYVLTIDINKCLNCGRMIVTMGTLLEQAMDGFDSNTETKDASLYEVNRVNHGYNLLNYDIDLDIYNGTDNAEDHDNNTLFKIENQIYMYGGLWKALICTHDGRYCALVDIASTKEVFSSLPILRKIEEKITTARLFFLVSMVIAVLTIISETFDVLVWRSNAFMSMFIGSLCSALVSLTGVATASLPFLNVIDIDDVISVHTPWSLILMLLTDYLFLAAAFRIWRTWRTLYQNTSKVTFHWSFKIKKDNNRKNIAYLFIQKFFSVDLDNMSQKSKVTHYV